jgi:hypothetical protein
MRPPLTCRVVVAPLLSLAVWLSAGDLRGQEKTSETRASELFEEGMKLKNGGKCAEAVPLFEESQRLVSGQGKQRHLAECLVTLGRLTAARAVNLQIAAVAAARGDAATEQATKAEAEALTARMPRVKVVVSNETNAIPGLELWRDGVPIERGQWAVPTPLDPGTHTITATAPGHSPWEGKVELAPDGKETTVSVGAPQPLPVPLRIVLPKGVEGLRVEIDGQPSTTSPSLKPGKHTVRATAPGRKPATYEVTLAPGQTGAELVIAPLETDGDGQGLIIEGGSSQRTWGLVAGGVGLAAVGAGAYFGLNAMSLNDDSAAHCNGNNLCDDTGVGLRDDAIGSATISTVLFIAGGAALTGGILLYVTAPSSPDAAAPTTGIVLGPSSAAFRTSF